MKTGYENSLKDFFALCLDHSNEVAPLIRKWFGYDVMPADGRFLLRDSGGADIDPEIVHERIQADPDRQGRIYRVAMTLWR
ncbi:MAG: hypothetical protein ABIZ80_07455 [Bryobacteraceae bacterium]